MVDNTDLNNLLKETIDAGKNIIRYDENSKHFDDNLGITKDPKYGTIDLVVRERVDILPGRSYEFSPPFELTLNAVTFGLIQPVHSVGSKRPYIVQSTTVNPNYTGRLTVSIFNSGHSAIELLPGEHIAQLLLVNATSFFIE